MFTLPHLLEDDIRALDAALADFISRSTATAALITDRGGFIVTQKGDIARLDSSTLGALAANSFAATEAIAKLIDEPTVSSLYQQGEINSVLILCIDEYGFLVIVFPAVIGVGSVKFFAESTLRRVTAQLNAACERRPDASIDLVEMNLADTAPLFKRR
jgi:predicted regulator of Ras-like GTPase activity (Roadblock/LC7/MglB family)